MIRLNLHPGARRRARAHRLASLLSLGVALAAVGWMHWLTGQAEQARERAGTMRARLQEIERRARTAAPGEVRAANRWLADSACRLRTLAATTPEGVVLDRIAFAGAGDELAGRAREVAQLEPLLAALSPDGSALASVEWSDSKEHEPLRHFRVVATPG